MKIARRVAALSAAVVLVAGGLVRGQVMEQIPSGALFAVKIANLSATSKKVSKLANDFGIAAFIPDARDPLGALMRKGKIEKGIDTTGEMAIVYLDPKVAGGDEDRSVIALIPVSDYAAFLTNFEGAKTEDGITEATMGNSPTPSYIASWGKYAAISPTKLIVEKKAESMLKPAGVSAEQVAKQDFVLYANFAKIRETVLPELKANREKLLGDMTKEIDANPDAAKFKPLLEALANQGLNAAEAFLRDSTAATVGVNITDAGINTTVLAEFAPESYLGGVVKSLKNTDASLTTGLPNQKYLFFGGSSLDGATFTKVYDDFTGPIVAELEKGGDQFAPVKEYAASMRKFMVSGKGGTFGAFSPTGALGTEAVFQTITILHGDPAAMEDAIKSMTTAAPGLMKAFGGANPALANMKVTSTPNAKTIDGVSFTAYKTDLGLDPESPEGKQQAQVMAMIYGPEGQTTNVATVGKDLFAFQGVPDEKVSLSLKALKDGDKSLAGLEQVKSVAAELPKQRFMEFYIPLDEIINTGVNAAGQFGVPVQLQLPPDLAPIGVTGSTDGSALRIDYHVPSSTVQSLIAAGMQVMMQMNGGAKPGGAGGL